MRAEFRLPALFALALLVMTAGLGLRDPWPPDEPRFVLIGRDMLATGGWLVPRLAGELYAQKPPLYFWAEATSLAAVPWPRVAFLLPSLLSALLTLALVHDLGRRLWGREAGLAAAGFLLATVQFVVQARSAQIDMSVTCWITLGLYALARHLLLGPAWGWYYVAWAAAGAGILTKGVGFLHLLFLVPYLLLRQEKSPRGAWLHAVAGPLTLLAVLAAWGLPMLLAARGDPALAAYRDELLLGQTVGRYVDPEGHRHPPWFFLSSVIPLLWQPTILLLPWLVPRWRAAWREGSRAPLMFLGWALLVLLFFSASPGKRGVYLLPALPALALAAAPFLPELLRRPGVQRTALAVTGIVTLAAAALALQLWLRGLPANLAADAGVAREFALLSAAIAIVALAGAVTAACSRQARAIAALVVVIAAGWLILGWWGTPALNDMRSGRRIVLAAEARTGAGALAMIDWKEQFMLHAQQPVTHFGWRVRDHRAEAAAAAAWLAGDPGRRVLLPEAQVAGCFDRAALASVGTAHDHEWFIAAPAAVNAQCRRGRGDLPVAVLYTPPALWPARVSGP